MMSNLAIDCLSSELTLDSGQSNLNKHISIAKNSSQSVSSGKSPKTYPVFAISFEDTLLKLNKPVTLNVRNVDGVIFAENEEYDISGYGESLREALEDASGDIAYYLRHYASLEKEQLVGSGLKLKELYGKLKQV